MGGGVRIGLNDQTVFDSQEKRLPCEQRRSNEPVNGSRSGGVRNAVG